MESVAVFSKTCRRCGRTASTPCPGLRNIPAAAEQLAGWGWDERGFVICPECAAAPAPVSVERGPDQGSLF